MIPLSQLQSLTLEFRSLSFALRQRDVTAICAFFTTSDVLT